MTDGMLSGVDGCELVARSGTGVTRVLGLIPGRCTTGTTGDIPAWMSTLTCPLPSAQRPCS